MTSRYKYYERVEDAYLGKHPGMIDIKALQEAYIGDNDYYYTIPFNRQYRPDLISMDFYGSTSLQWIITFINNIGDSPEGYYINRIIRVPNEETVRRFL